MYVIYLGIYKTLSATTNPTRKNKLEAGKNGSTIKSTPTNMASGT